MTRRLRVAVIIGVFALGVGGGTADAGLNFQGLNFQGLNFQGLNFQGLNFQGLNFQGLNFQGLNFQGLNFQGLNFQGLNFQGLNFQGLNFQGLNFQGLNFQGLNFQGLNFQGAPLTGIDRARGFSAPVQMLDLALADAQLPGSNLQGLQPCSVNSSGVQTCAPVNYVQVSSPMSGVQLQASPTDTSPGDYIFVPGLSGTPSDIKGTFWNMMVGDTCTDSTQCTSPATCVAGVCQQSCASNADCASPAECTQGACSNTVGSVVVYVADVEQDTRLNSSKYPANSDMYIYTVYYRQPATGDWSALCPLDIYGEPRAVAVPVNLHDWASPASRASFAFACTGSGVAAKCARNWGYKPWKTVRESVWNGAAFADAPIPMQPLYDACLIAARAAYCQDDASYTENGTLVDLFDSLDGFTSINPTVGLPYAPSSPGVMLHEEYQVSGLQIGSSPAAPYFVSGDFTSDQLMSLPPSQESLVSSLRRSGMESSRYPDLDPGRSCAAAPYIDRCDPKEPYDCYRAINMTTEPYGAFLAVNSPRHCSHDEDHDGEALDPLCNECVNRVCQVDPTCCGDPGATFYPGSLVWDERCTAIRQQVCKNDPDPSTPLWPPGATAPIAGSHPVVYLNGAIGSFEGIVTEGGTEYAEGWACDPDHPGASVPLQISIGGQMGATGAELYTSAADQPLVPAWRDTVALQCGGAGRHGFRFPIPAGSEGQDVYVYGIDLDVPGAPYSLLRGGKKTSPPLPPTTPPAPTSPLAGIWTGWVGPSVTGNYVFSANVGPTDRYRLWVNGIYVAGNWVDSDPTAPGAFTLTAPATPPALYLRAGLRYAVRIEYLRPDTLTTDGSQFSLSWASPDSPPAVAAGPIPATALYPVAPGSGNGLAGSFYSGSSLPAAGTAVAPVGQSVGAVDFLWTTGNPPVPASSGAAGLGVQDTFAARFVGQVVVPLSGDYQFSVDTDDTAQITVNGQVANTGSTMPASDPATCPHDICATGAAVSKTCAQGYFCAGQICAQDPGCCSYTWDAICVNEVATVCGLTCNPTPPISITLQAGVKYEIEVDYQHTGTINSAVVHGARLRLMWALAGAERAAIPQTNLFSETPIASLGVGLNAAYFASNSAGPFQTEYLDHVEGPIAFTAANPPVAARSASMICGGAGAPACDATGDVQGAPALTAPVTGSTVVGPTVTVSGVGATRAGSVGIFECTVDPVTQACQQDPTTGAEDWSSQVGSAAVSGACDGVTSGSENCGAFTATLTLSTGATHWLAAAQTASGSTGAGRIQLFVMSAPDPLAPRPPVVAQPSTGLTSGDGAVSVGGSGAANAPVTVTATSGPARKTFTLQADASGNFSGTITLPPGDWSVTFTQTVNGHTSSASQALDVKVALPSLTVTSPNDQSTITGSTLLAGAGASPTLVNVIVGDGDGQVFAQRANSSLTVQPDGSFSGTLVPSQTAVSGALALDYGKHQLKVFQETGGLEGAGVIRTVSVPPPAPTVASVTSAGVDPASAETTISPADGAVVQPKLTINGTGLPRTALRGSAIVYQGSTPVGQGPLADDGTFAVSVTLTGAGSQQLSVTQLASSLSGAGTAESSPTTFSVVLRPGPPIITTPGTSTNVPAAPLVVAGTAAPVALVTILVDGVAQPPLTAAPDGSFTTDGTPSQNLSLSQGVHHLIPYQTVAGARGPNGTEVLIAVGDLTPPTVTIASVTDAQGNSSRNVSAVATDATGTIVSFADRISAVDGTTSLPACPPCATASCPTPQCWACVPASGSQFPLGSTSVTCTATDAAGNVGSTSFDVTVTSSTPPLVEGQNLVAEALGPTGAPVNYQISATGFIADCSPTGSTTVVPCTSWQPAYTGLGFVPGRITQNPTDGTLYANMYGDSENYLDGAVNAPASERLFSSTDGGSTWKQLTPSGAGLINSMVAAGGSPATLYVSSDQGRGIKVTHDGGTTWSSALDGQTVSNIYIDFAHPTHSFARSINQNSLLETLDGWATWGPASEGLPTDHTVYWVAVDPISPERVYATLAPNAGDSAKTIIYRRVGSGPWQRLNVPAYPNVLSQAAPAVTVSPQIAPGQTYPTVFAGPVYSTDGGETWLNNAGLFTFLSMVFSPADPSVAYANLGGIYKSSDGGSTWVKTSVEGAPYNAGPLVADAHDPQTLYATSGLDPVFGAGLYKSVDGGATWAPVEAPGMALQGARVQDIATDPVDPRVAYLLSDRGGVFKTTDGGSSWVSSSSGITEFSDLVNASKIDVDRFNRNNVYVGRAGLWKSPDGAQSWSDISAGDYNVLTETTFALDPTTPNTVVLMGGDNDAPLATFGGGAFDLVTLSNGVETQNVGQVNAFGESERPYSYQLVPDIARTAIVSWLGSSGGVGIFSIAALQADNGGVGTDLGLGLSSVIYDRSDGVNRLFIGGSFVPGGDPSLLYTDTVADVAALAPEMTWNPLGTPGGAVFSDFSRLLVDPASGGQTMYTVGTANTLWESHDGGRTWQMDASVPSFLTNIWLSQVDGSLFATLAPAQHDTSTQFYSQYQVDWSPGVLWKRTPATGVPPGARIVQANLRPVCTGGNGVQAVTPGSMFPIGATPLTCTVTDAFGNTQTQVIDVTVKDTTPPSLTVPSNIFLNAGADGTTTFTFTATATDLVDGPVTPVCSPASGSSFSVGVTTVICTATDSHGNIGRASFPVVVSPNGATTALAPPVLSLPGDTTVEASGPAGTPVTMIVSATTGSPTPTSLKVVCSVPVDGSFTFPLGETDVTCSATDTSVTPALTSSAIVRVTVVDTTPPLLTLPPDFTLAAEGPWGVRNVQFDAQPSAAPGGAIAVATDAVAGVFAPSCSPESGSTFPVGTTLVTCVAIDEAGNSTRGSFHITVTGAPPTLVLPTTPMVVQAVDQLGAPVNYAASVGATDMNGQPVAVDCLPPSGSVFLMGDTTVSCTASDAQGESSGSFVVRVDDTAVPTVTVPSTLTLEATGPAGSPVLFTSTPPTLTLAVTNSAGVTSSYVVSTFDLVSGHPSPTCRVVTEVTDPVTIVPGPTPVEFPLGNDVVTCSATDTSGNTGSASFTIVVRDTTPPTLTLPTPSAPGGAAITLASDPSGGATVTFVATATDLVSGSVAVACTPASGSRFLVGTTAVSCVARDAAGNGATGGFLVAVTLPSNGSHCSTGAQCASGLCVDGVCCATSCGGGDPTDCQACSVAAGGSTDGVCTTLSTSHICRPSAGACDVAEACNGSSVSCPSDQLAAQGTTCRPSAGACDVAETCTGSSAACPADTLAPAGQVCRPSAGVCDVAETCTGTAAACPPDGFAPASQVCRPSAGACDVAEACTGTSAACPADTLAPAGQVCRPSAGVCDVAETCTGTSAACPPDGFAPASQVCRPSAGVCDVAETCTGTSVACPPDGFVAAGQVCRPKAGVCDVAETCTGTAAACPPDGFVAAGTVCQPAANVCQNPGTCTGAQATCPGASPIPGCVLDTTPPVFSNVPATVVAYATSTSGVKVTYTNPQAIDAVDGVRPVTCTPPSGSTFAPGQTTVTCTASDKSGNVATATFVVWVQYQAPTDGTFFLPPIRPDGSAVFAIGRPVPTRFRLTGSSAGITNLHATFSATKISSTVQGTVVVVSDETVNDTSGVFTYRSAQGYYMYRWKTSDQTAGTYQLRANLGDGVIHQVNVSLKGSK